MRSLQQAPTLENVQKKLGIKRTSLGSLSESSDIFDPKLLKPIISQLANKADSLKLEKRLNDFDLTLVAVDDTLLKALLKMLWALRRDNNSAVKIHLELDLVKSLPLNAKVTNATADEATILDSQLTSNKLYILDASYRTYKVLDNIIQKKQFICYTLTNTTPVIKLSRNGLLAMLISKQH